MRKVLCLLALSVAILDAKDDKNRFVRDGLTIGDQPAQCFADASGLLHSSLGGSTNAEQRVEELKSVTLPAFTRVVKIDLAPIPPDNSFEPFVVTQRNPWNPSETISTTVAPQSHGYIWLIKAEDQKACWVKRSDLKIRWLDTTTGKVYIAASWIKKEKDLKHAILAP